MSSQELSPGERVVMAAELLEAAVALLRARLKRERPEMTEEELDQAEVDWLRAPQQVPGVETSWEAWCSASSRR